jgi:hypothetical protein
MMTSNEVKTVTSCHSLNVFTPFTQHHLSDYTKITLNLHTSHLSPTAITSVAPGTHSSHQVRLIAFFPPQSIPRYLAAYNWRIQINREKTQVAGCFRQTKRRPLKRKGQISGAGRLLH